MLAHPSYPATRHSLPEIAAILRETCASPQHEFWPEGLDFLDPSRIHHHALRGPSQVTDAYLPALAVARDQTFATFDQRLTTATVRGAKAHHLGILNPLAA